MYRFFVPALVVSLLTGAFAGSALTAWSIPSQVPMAIVEDTAHDVSTITIDGIFNGELVGSAQGDVRISAGGTLVTPGSGGVFRIADTRVLTNVIHIVIPKGMEFVASVKGKKYYPVRAASAAQIVPRNRVYFPTEEAARAAGYIR